MNKYFTLTLFLSCILCIQAFAQTDIRIKGKIIDDETREPVELADVVLFTASGETAAHTIPAKDGSFAFRDITDGTYSVLVSMIGYDVYTNPEIVLGGNTPVLDMGTIALVPLGTEIAEVEVVARKNQVVYKLDKKVIDAAASLMSSGGSAVDILENTPSIRVDAEGEVTFRGSSGFAVYVDGKPSIFSGTQALEQIPAGHIENIELITTPSARHDSEGDVGIINIITKKETQHGVSGMVNVSVSTLLSREADFLLTWQKNKSRWSVGGAFTERLRESDFMQEKTTLGDTLDITSRSDGPRKSNNFDYNFKAGWAYALPKTDLNIDLQGGHGGRKRDGDLLYRERKYYILRDSLAENGYNSRDFYHIYETYLNASAGFTHRFNDDGHQLSGSFYAKYGGNAMEYFESELYNLTGELREGHKAWEDEHRWTVRGNLDYVLPYSDKGRLEAGYQYFSYLEDGDYTMHFWQNDVREFVNNPNIYNTFYFQRGVHSIYAIVGESIGKFDVQAGVRGEHTHRVLRSSIEGMDRTFNRFELFPSAHMGYNFPNEHILMAASSRRTTRPELFFMEPYLTFRDFYSAEIGNPDVRPEYIDSFEINYKKNIGDNSVSATVFHRSRKDKIERLRVPLKGIEYLDIPFHEGVTLDSMANVGNDFSTGLELNAQLTAVRWWNITLNGSVYHYKVKNFRDETKIGLDGRTETSTNYDVTLNNSFDLTKSTRLQFDGNFVGPSVTTQGRTDSFWYCNMAVRQQLCQRKLTAVLAFRDVFNSARYVSDINTADLRSYTKIRPKYPLITLSFSYTFNNFTRKNTQNSTNHDLFEGTNH